MIFKTKKKKKKKEPYKNLQTKAMKFWPQIIH